MKTLIETLASAAQTTNDQQGLRSLIAQVLEVEGDEDGIDGVSIGANGNRVEMNSSGVALASSDGKRITLKELIAAVEFLEFLRERFNERALTNSILGLSENAKGQLKALGSLALADNQLFATGSNQIIGLIPQSVFQGANANLAAIAALTLTGNRLIGTASNGAIGLYNVTSFQPANTTLTAIGNLTLAPNLVFGTDASSNVSLVAGSSSSRPIGSIITVPYSVSGNPWIDSDGYYWFQPDGTAIGNFNSRYQKLYTALWATYGVNGGRGASAAADWSAGKTLAIPDFRGRAIVTAGTGSGLSNRAVGQTWGAENMTLTNNELPAHRHNVSVATITATGIAAGSTGYGVISLFSVVPSQSSVAGNRTAANDGLGAIRDQGLGNSFGLSQPSAAFTMLWWMGEKA